MTAIPKLSTLSLAASSVLTTARAQASALYLRSHKTLSQAAAHPAVSKALRAVQLHKGKIGIALISVLGLVFIIRKSPTVPPKVKVKEEPAVEPKVEAQAQEITDAEARTCEIIALSKEVQEKANALFKGLSEDNEIILGLKGFDWQKVGERVREDASLSDLDSLPTAKKVLDSYLQANCEATSEQLELNARAKLFAEAISRFEKERVKGQFDRQKIVNALDFLKQVPRKELTLDKVLTKLNFRTFRSEQMAARVVTCLEGLTSKSTRKIAHIELQTDIQKLKMAIEKVAPKNTEEFGEPEAVLNQILPKPLDQIEADVRQEIVRILAGWCDDYREHIKYANATCRRQNAPELSDKIKSLAKDFPANRMSPEQIFMSAWEECYSQSFADVSDSFKQSKKATPT